jgi:hypothetical protein
VRLRILPKAPGVPRKNGVSSEPLPVFDVEREMALNPLSNPRPGAHAGGHMLFDN